jgi:hypothetical protein
MYLILHWEASDADTIARHGNHRPFRQFRAAAAKNRLQQVNNCLGPEAFNTNANDRRSNCAGQNCVARYRVGRSSSLRVSAK